MRFDRFAVLNGPTLNSRLWGPRSYIANTPYLKDSLGQRTLDVCGKA